MSSSTTQSPLFVEDIYEALRAIVRHIGGSKIVGHDLWPELPVEQAGRKVDDCLNRERNQKFDPEQVVLLFRRARDAQFHVAKHFFDQETGYVPSLPSDPLDEQQRIVETIEQTGLILQRALTALDKMRDRGKPLTKVA